jgi:hypothetical protein
MGIDTSIEHDYLRDMFFINATGWVLLSCFEEKDQYSKKLPNDKMLDGLQPIDNTVREVSIAR